MPQADKVWVEGYLLADRRVAFDSDNKMFQKTLISLDDHSNLLSIFETVSRNPLRSDPPYPVFSEAHRFQIFLEGPSKNESQCIWRFPNGHGVLAGSDGFCHTLENYYKQQKDLADYRNLENVYQMILDTYLKQLASNTDYWLYEARVEPIATILRKESYIWLSENQDLVERYRQCKKLIADLYGCYQLLVR